MVKRKQGESTGRDEFVEAVLEMLDEGVQLYALNLRQVARRVGCAHTNAYNYFSSFSEMLWWALREALERLMSSTGRNNTDLIDVYIDFALEHPAWFRLIWLDTLGGSPPREVADFLSEPSDLFLSWLAGKLNLPKDDEHVVRGARMLNSFLHGELVAFTTGRLEHSTSEFREQLISNTDMLYELLFGDVRRKE